MIEFCLKILQETLASKEARMANGVSGLFDQLSYDAEREIEKERQLSTLVFARSVSFVVVVIFLE